MTRTSAPRVHLPLAYLCPSRHLIFLEEVEYEVDVRLIKALWLSRAVSALARMAKIQRIIPPRHSAIMSKGVLCVLCVALT